MKFDNLEDRMNYFRDLADYKLIPNSYVLAMVDGRGFSSKIKKRFKLPFDDTFIDIMNQVAAYVCKEIQGCKFAFAQSDEISFIITDFDTPESDSFFGYRLCKMQSIIAGLATAKFNQLIWKELLATPCSTENLVQMMEDQPLYHFDCKCWNVPTHNDAIGWILYRQNDCIRNSKQQAAQTYLSHKALVGKHTDEQIELLKREKGIDWNTEYDDGKKYGRFIFKEEKTLYTAQNEPYIRSYFTIHNGCPLTIEENREIIKNLIPKRDC